MLSDTIMQTQTLFISAGHSARDPGAVGNGHTEADIVTGFRDLVADELAGHVSFNTDGQKGENLPLRKAVQIGIHLLKFYKEVFCQIQFNKWLMVAYGSPLLWE